MTTPEVILERLRQADEAAKSGPSSAESPPGPIPQTLRFGVAQIDSNDGGGAYTITEQRWDAGTSAWVDGIKPARWVAKSARDFQERATAAADDYVLFWEQRDDTGALEILIDVGISLPTGVKGDILWHNGTAWVVLNVGSEGDVLVVGADDAIEWETPAACT